MCGILAVLLANGGEECVQELVDGLVALQHRGQDAAGIVTASTSCEWEKTKFNIHTDKGAVKDVFQQQDVAQLHGNVGVAHVRYPTAGAQTRREAQPLYVNYPCGLVLAHNGNLTNANEERLEVVRKLRHINTTSDSEVLLNVFAEELQRALGQRAEEKIGKVEKSNGHSRAPLQYRPSLVADDFISPEFLFKAVKATMLRCRGSYAVTMLIHNVGILGFRDPWGIRPLVLGSRESSTLPDGCDYCLTSESAACDVLGYNLVGDVAPGEAVLLLPMKPGGPRSNKGMFRQQCHDAPVLAPCIFEYVYFARADSIIDGVSVYEARLRMGEHLARKIKRIHGDNHGIDVVIPVPDTSRTSALACANTLGCLYRDGFVKNHYIGRTFIMPGQAKRRKSVRMKLNPIKAEFEGRTVLLVDDSIVRGTTTKELVIMALEAGAKSVCITSASPEVRHPNVYGIDIPTRAELIATGREPAQIATELGAKWIVYQDLADLNSAVSAFNPKLVRFEDSVFSGEYVTGDITPEYLDALEQARAC